MNYSPPAKTIIDPRGGRWTVTLDSRTRPVASVDPAGKSDELQVGLVLVAGPHPGNRRPRRPHHVRLPRDGGGDIPAVVGADGGGDVQLAYDGNGRMRQTTDQLGNVSTIVWDGQGNRKAVIDPYGVRPPGCMTATAGCRRKVSVRDNHPCRPW